MTEKEYVNAQAIGTVNVLFETLKQLTPKNHESEIPRKELDEVARHLYRWRERLLLSVEVDNVIDYEHGEDCGCNDCYCKTYHK